VVDVILYPVIMLGAVAGISAILLFLTAKKFHVEEDPRIDTVAGLLPGANCGGCGYPGCRGLAEAIVKAADKGDIGGLSCPPGGSAAMKAIGDALGMAVAESDPMVAVLRCNGTHEKAPRTLKYDGAPKCVIAHTVFVGEKGCPNGCLGLGDCVTVCAFGAMYMDDKTGLPVILADKCVACGACVKSCPRRIIEMRPKGRKDRRVWVDCVNTEKGAAAMKYCKAACIACGKCVKECPEKVQAITLTNNLAYIDPKKCIACGKCIVVCPTKAIHATFEPPQPKPAAEAPKSVETPKATPAA